MTKKYTKKYNVTWEETHSVIIEAKDKEEAIEKVNEGYGSDDAAKMSSGFDAQEIEK